MPTCFVQQLSPPLAALAIVACCIAGALAGLMAASIAMRRVGGIANLPTKTASAIAGLLAFAFILMCHGASLQAIAVCILSTLLIALSLTDLAARIIPNTYLIAGVVTWALAFAMLCLSVQPTQWASIANRLLDSLAGSLGVSAIVLCLALVLDRLTGTENLGAGDVKLLFVTGLFLGFEGNVLNLFLSCLIGAIFGFAYTRLHPKKSMTFPFGPAIAISTFTCLVILPSLPGAFFV